MMDIARMPRQNLRRVLYSPVMIDDGFPPLPLAPQEMTVDVSSSHFLFTIPVTATPSFRTAMVSLNWALHLELLVGSPPNDMSWLSLSRSLSGASQPMLHKLLWSLPLVVSSPLR